LCMTEGPAKEVEFIACDQEPQEGFHSRGKVVGVSPMLIDLVGEPPAGPFCPPEADKLARSPLPPRDKLLCLDS
jgi:hypothetical protein